MKSKNIVVGSLFAIVVSMFAVSANADTYGVWNKYDFKLKVTEDPKVQLRFTPEFVFTDEAPNAGLRQVVTRLGPNLAVTPWLTVGVNGYVSQNMGKQDVRPEFQPDLSFKFGNVAVNDRNRLSYKALDSGAGDRVQYANELKVSWDSTCSLYPFLSEEAFIGSGYGFTQNKATVGMGYKFNTSNRFEVGYMMRSHNDNSDTWKQDHFLFVSTAASF